MKYIIPFLLVSLVVFVSCNTSSQNKNLKNNTINDSESENFEIAAEQFSDLQVLRYQVPGFNSLTSTQKELCYYLYEAALCGRDIIYDQKSKNGLTLRKTIENIYENYSGDKSNENWKKFEIYAGRFWFSNGNHHHYGNEKFFPECNEKYFAELIKNCPKEKFPLNTNENVDQFITRIIPIIFDKTIEPKLVNLSANIDNVKNSSVNFYENVTQKEVETYYKKFPTQGNQPSWGLNSKLIKENGEIKEQVWKSGGMYGSAIDKIIYWLEKAATVAENNKQKDALLKLAKYYKTGDLKDFDEYCIAWVKDIDSQIDVVNGFIEVYNDPIGKRGSFESVVSIRDMEATKRISAIAKQAQWFEDNSPLIPEHKKKEVKGITAKAITAVVESGDAAPTTAIGINLPNADWIRKEIGSKSVSLSNIINSYNLMSAKKGTLDEFGLNDEIKNLIKKHGALASDLHTDMHECIGHASGQINPGVGTTDETLKNYASCLEEARADLVALYYILDKKLIDIGVMPSLDVAKAEYNSYIMNGLIVQLTRIKLGDNIEEAHMRNRQLVAAWAYEKGKTDNVIEWVKQNNKTYVKINDYDKLRTLFGQLLRELQRIKSEGDYKAGRDLVENYGVKINPTLHKEVLDRFSTLDVKPYRGFIQPKLIPIFNDNKIIDVKIEYPKSFFAQMIEYGKNYALLPVQN